MDTNRIISFCKRKLKKEGMDLSGITSPRGAAFNEVLEFIEKAETASKSEVEQIKEIFIRNYTDYTLDAYKKKMTYNFSRAETNHAKKLIPLMKEYIYHNDEIQDDMSVANFFNMFLQRMPEWWKTHSYNFAAIARNFNKIITQMLHDKKHRTQYNGQGTSHSNKPTIEDVTAAINYGNTGEQ